MEKDERLEIKEAFVWAWHQRDEAERCRCLEDSSGGTEKRSRNLSEGINFWNISAEKVGGGWRTGHRVHGAAPFPLPAVSSPLSSQKGVTANSGGPCKALSYTRDMAYFEVLIRSFSSWTASSRRCALSPLIKSFSVPCRATWHLAKTDVPA